MTAVVEELASTSVDCPCGCGRRHEQHDGKVISADGGGCYFRALLVREGDGEPGIWLAIVTAPLVQSTDPRDWLATFRCDRVGADIEDPAASPVHIASHFQGRRLAREELLAMPGIADTYFRVIDTLMSHHSRFLPFLLDE